jgi:hypothetical protein
MMGNQIFPVELLEYSMDQNDENVEVPNSIEEVAIRGMALSEALYEILADRGILTQLDVIVRIRKLKAEIKTNQRPS